MVKILQLKKSSNILVMQKKATPIKVYINGEFSDVQFRTNLKYLVQKIQKSFL